MSGWFTSEQRARLEEFYKTWDGTPSEENESRIELVMLATGLSRLQVRGWLRNRQMRGNYKGRVVHSVLQVRGLEWMYKNCSEYPSSHMKKKIGVVLHMATDQVNKWFETRRRRGTPKAVVKAQHDQSMEWLSLQAQLKRLAMAEAGHHHRTFQEIKRKSHAATKQATPSYCLATSPSPVGPQGTTALPEAPIPSLPLPAPAPAPAPPPMMPPPCNLQPISNAPIMTKFSPSMNRYRSHTSFKDDFRFIGSSLVSSFASLQDEKRQQEQFYALEMDPRRQPLFVPEAGHHLRYEAPPVAPQLKGVKEEKQEIPQPITITGPPAPISAFDEPAKEAILAFSNHKYSIDFLCS